MIDALDQAIYDTVHDYRAPDGHVTRAEVRRVQQRFIGAAKAGMEFLARLEAIAEDDDA